MKKKLILMLVIVIFTTSFSCGPRRYKCGPYRKCEMKENSIKKEFYSDFHKTYTI